MYKYKKAIYILGGGMKKTANGNWRTTAFGESGDDFGTLGDNLRIMAGFHLWQDNNDLVLVVSGSKGQLKNNPVAPTVASVMKNELVGLGVPSVKIIEESSSGNTWQNLIALKGFLAEGGYKKISLISNRWHLPRIKAMMTKIKELHQALGSGQIILLSAEDILINSDSQRWKEYINDIYETPKVKARIKQENKGLVDLKDGTYSLS